MGHGFVGVIRRPRIDAVLRSRSDPTRHHIFGSRDVVYVPATHLATNDLRTTPIPTRTIEVDLGRADLLPRAARLERPPALTRNVLAVQNGRARHKPMRYRALRPGDRRR